jgi:hypothetical protein
MIAHEVKQGSWDWLQMRLGIPTASNFDRIMTPKTRKASGQAAGYMHELLAERLLGHPLEESSGAGMTPLMQRGNLLELEAVKAYEFERDVDTEPGGFILSDSGLYGASPDRLVGDEGLLEVKCVSAKNHVAAMLGCNDDDHVSQCMGQMLVSGRKWVDNLFYNPVLPSHIVRISRDLSYIGQLQMHLDAFCSQLEREFSRLKAMPGVIRG